MNQKLEKLKLWMSQQNIETAYISQPEHVAYFTGFNSEPHERILALFISLNHDPFLFTPALDVEDAQNSGWPFEVIGYLDSQNPWDKVAHELKARFGAFSTMAIEKEGLSVKRYEELRSRLANCDFSTDLTAVLQEMHLHKSLEEKQLMLEAGNWADVAFEIGFKAIAEGVMEQEIVAEIEYQLKKRGVSQMSFDTLVLAGKNAASPHGEPGENQVQKNELVLFDLGVVWKGYCSDATRTVSYLEPTDFQRKIYDIVLEAQLAATTAVRPGIKASELDKIARDVISSYGYGEYFNHRLGHGIGTTVHEFPSLVAGNDLVIEEGMCFSIEPGIYIPGEVGVRIEDCLFVTKDGAENFTKTTKELQIIS